MCFICNDKGHFAKNCPQRGSIQKRLECFKCGKEGHIAKECRDNSSDDQNKSKETSNFCIDQVYEENALKIITEQKNLLRDKKSLFAEGEMDIVPMDFDENTGRDDSDHPEEEKEDRESAMEIEEDGVKDTDYLSWSINKLKEFLLAKGQITSGTKSQLLHQVEQIY